MARVLGEVLQAGVAQGVITAEQRDALLAIGADAGPGAAAAEAPRGLSGVTIAYAIGALLVIFACAWFLVNRWASLGGWGVLGVALAYAAILVVAGRQLTRLGFPRAAGLTFMLAISLTPLVAWSVLDLTGEWPRVPPTDRMLQYLPYMASRFLVLELATLLVALLAWRARRFPALTVVFAVTSWGIFFHLAQVLEEGTYGDWYARWILLAGALFLLATADTVDRWQRREGVREREGDYAGPLWYVGLVAFAIGYLVLWGGSNAGRHSLPLVSAVFLWLSLATGRTSIAFLGVVGVFGYLAFLASDVFKTGAAFPLVLAALGILTILATVWLQRRWPALARRVAGEGQGPRWPMVVSWIPMVGALAMSAANLRSVGEAMRVREAAQRDVILKQHREAQAGILKPGPLPRR